MKKHILFLSALVTLINVLCVNAMETNPNARISYYNDQPITKELVLSDKVGPQAVPEVHKAAALILANNPQIIKTRKRPSTVTLETTREFINKEKNLPKLSFTVLIGTKDKTYGIWGSKYLNEVISMWHGQQELDKIPFWTSTNQTDDNFRKITATDSLQNISPRACLLAMLDAYKRVPDEHKKYVKILPVYLHNAYGQEETNKTTDERYVVIHQTLSKSVVLADNPHVIASIPHDAINSLYRMIMDDRSGAAGALWANNGITVKLDKENKFQYWVLGLKEKPNNQKQQIFFNGDKQFQENCQYEGLKTLAEVFNTSKDKTALLTLQKLVNADKSIPETSGRFTNLKNQLTQLLETKKS